MTVYELQRQTLGRIGEDPDLDPSLMYYTPQEVLTALNQVQRLFVLFTLCLETTANFALSGQAAGYHMLDTFGDWILPLRIRNASGAKMRPKKLVELAMLDGSWRSRTGTPIHYVHSGLDLLSVYKADTSVVPITYARSPIQLLSTWPTDNGQSPEIPPENHQDLIEGAIPILRVKEGAQEWQKTIGCWDRFTAAADSLAKYVRARNRELGYDAMPPELKRFDRSHVLQKAG